MIENRIIKTVRLFSIQNCAVTLLEIHRYVVSVDAQEQGEVPVAVETVLATLDRLRARGVVVQAHGYYALAGCETACIARWRGYRFGVWREKIIRKTMWGLAYIPFVRGVGLAGSQALGLQKAESDIDLLVITEPGWLWLPRTLVTAYFQVLGIRRYGVKVANRVCLNHYLSGAKAMRTGQNWYTALEYAKLRPLVGAEVIAEFQEANRKWIEEIFPNAAPVVMRDEKRSKVQMIGERLCANAVGKSAERVLGNWQSKRIHKDEPHIIVEVDELSFHPKSKQDALLEKFA